MARSRVIKPEFWSDEKVGSLSLFERLLFVGTWTFADDEGLVRANPLYLRSVVFPYDNIKEADLQKALDTLAKQELLFPYNSSDQKYAWIIKFRVYQSIDRPQKPNHPCPRFNDPKYKLAILKRDGLKCYICGRQLEKKEFYFKGQDSPYADDIPSIDHIVPQDKGGSDYPTNLKTSCLKCNKSKHIKGIDEITIADENVRRMFDECSQHPLDETETETEVKQKHNMSGNTPDVIPFERIVDHLNEKTGKDFKATTASTKKHIQARWNEGHRVDHFLKVIDVMCSRWLFDPKMMDYLRPETLFGIKFESYLNNSESSTTGGKIW